MYRQLTCCIYRGRGIWSLIKPVTLWAEDDVTPHSQWKRIHYNYR